MASPGRILVPIDFSRESRVALDYALSLAKALNASITLMHVYELPMLLNTIIPGADNAADADSARSEASRRLDAVRAELGDRVSGEIRLLIEPGKPAEAIVARARAGRFHMIVMGTHGRTGVARLLMGSVAELVVRRADCPVVTVHLPSEGTEGES